MRVIGERSVRPRDKPGKRRAKAWTGVTDAVMRMPKRCGDGSFVAQKEKKTGKAQNVKYTLLFYI